MKTRTDLMEKWAPLIAKRWQAQALILTACRQEASDRYKDYLKDAAAIGINADTAGKYWSAICNRAWALIGGSGKAPKP